MTIDPLDSPGCILPVANNIFLFYIATVGSVIFKTGIGRPIIDLPLFSI
jgi:hypothetical protein